MIVLSRTQNESIVINNAITLTVVEIRADKVRLGIVAPKEVPIHRQEVFEAIYGPPPWFGARSWSPEERAFLRAIEANPDDETARLMFADWLEERGDPLGEFLRVRCCLAKLPPGGRHRRGLNLRERALWAEHGTAWTRSVFPVVLGTLTPRY
jgi:carbon storage regulator